MQMKLHTHNCFLAKTLSALCNTNTHTTTAGSVTLVKARVRLGVNVWVVCMMQQWAESVCWPHQWEQPIKCYRWIRMRLSVGGHSSPHFSLYWQRALKVSLKVLMSSEKMQRKLRSPSLIYAKCFFLRSFLDLGFLIKATGRKNIHMTNHFLYAADWSKNKQCNIWLMTTNRNWSNSAKSNEFLPSIWLLCYSPTTKKKNTISISQDTQYTT